MITFIIVVPIIVFVLAINEYYYRVVSNDTQDYHMRMGGKGGPYDVISFGSAYCRFGIDFSESGINGYNFGYGSQFFYYTNLMLHEYAKTCKPGGIVYLIIADLVFARIGKGMYGSAEYVKFISKELLGDEFSYWRYLKDARFPLLFHPHYLRKVVRRILLGNRLSSFCTLQYSQLTAQQVEMEVDKRCKSWCRQFGLKDTISSEIPEELETVFISTRRILTNMIQFCLDSNLNPVLVITPISRIMSDKLSPAFMDKVLYDNINKANIQHVPVMDYLRDPGFSDYTLYHNNGDFLNSRGRKLFTKKLLKDTIL